MDMDFRFFRILETIQKNHFDEFIISEYAFPFPIYYFDKTHVKLTQLQNLQIVQV